MELLLFLGVISLILGVMFLFFPKRLKTISDSFNKVIFSMDENLLKMRIGFGICLTAIGLVALFLVYYFIKR